MIAQKLSSSSKRTFLAKREGRANSLALFALLDSKWIRDPRRRGRRRRREKKNLVTLGETGSCWSCLANCWFRIKVSIGSNEVDFFLTFPWSETKSTENRLELLTILLTIFFFPFFFLFLPLLLLDLKEKNSKTACGRTAWNRVLGVKKKKKNKCSRFVRILNETWLM